MNSCKVIAFFLVLLLGACASIEDYESHLWPKYAYSGFSEKIDRIAGGDAIDCGFYDLTQRNSNALKENAAGLSDCVKASIKSDKPFKIGSVRIPVDSAAYEVLVYSPEKEYWTIVFDWMLDGSNAIHWVKRCDSVNVDVKSLSYKGEGCREVSAEEWLSDIN